MEAFSPYFQYKSWDIYKTNRQFSGQLVCSRQVFEDCFKLIVLNLPLKRRKVSWQKNEASIKRHAISFNNKILFLYITKLHFLFPSKEVTKDDTRWNLDVQGELRTKIVQNYYKIIWSSTQNCVFVPNKSWFLAIKLFRTILCKLASSQ